LDLASVNTTESIKKLRQLEAAGFEVKHFSHSDPGAFISSLVGAKAPYFIEFMHFQTLSVILTANALDCRHITTSTISYLIWGEHFRTLLNPMRQITRDDYNA